MGTLTRTAAKPFASAAPSVQRHNLALQRLDAKKEIIGQIIDGRLQLLEAAAQFRQLNRATTAGTVPNGESDEDVCRSIIGWVYLALSERPERAEALSEQLEAELAAYLKLYGAVNLTP